MAAVAEVLRKIDSSKVSDSSYMIGWTSCDVLYS